MGKDERNEQATGSSDEGCEDSNDKEIKEEIKDKVTEVQNHTTMVDKQDYDKLDTSASNNELQSKSEEEKEDSSLLNKEDLLKVEKEIPIDSMKTKDPVGERTSSELEDKNRQIPSDVVNEKEGSLNKDESSLTQTNISDDIKDRHKSEVRDPVDMQQKTFEDVNIASDKSIEKPVDKKENSTEDIDQKYLEAKSNEEKCTKIVQDSTNIEEIKEVSTLEKDSKVSIQGGEVRKNKVNEENEIRPESEKVQAEQNELKKEEVNSINEVPAIHTPETLHPQSNDLNETSIADGVLDVEIIEASKLVNKDMIGKSDPYVKLKFKKDEFISKKIRNSLEPKWNFSVPLQISKEDSKELIEITVYDDDFGAENFIGSLVLPLSKLLTDKDIGGVWHDLKECKSGEICISSRFEASDETKGVKELTKEMHEKAVDKPKVNDKSAETTNKDTDGTSTLQNNNLSVQESNDKNKAMDQSSMEDLKFPKENKKEESKKSTEEKGVDEQKSEESSSLTRKSKEDLEDSVDHEISSDDLVKNDNSLKEKSVLLAEEEKETKVDKLQETKDAEKDVEVPKTNGERKESKEVSKLLIKENVNKEKELNMENSKDDKEDAETPDENNGFVPSVEKILDSAMPDSGKEQKEALLS